MEILHFAVVGFMNSRDSDQSKKLGFRNVVRLGYVSLFTDVSTEMILGILPFFIVQELGGTAAILGVIEGTAEAVNYAFRIVAGILTDRIGRRKPLVLLGYGLSSIAKPLFALASTWGQAFSVRVVDRAGKGTRTSPRDALISDSIAKSEAGKGFGLHRSLDQVGAVLGPLLAFVLIPLVGLRGVFWVSFLPATVALIILAFFVTDTRGLTKHRNPFETTTTTSRGMLSFPARAQPTGTPHAGIARTCSFPASHMEANLLRQELASLQPWLVSPLGSARIAAIPINSITSLGTIIAKEKFLLGISAFKVQDLTSWATRPGKAEATARISIGPRINTNGSIVTYHQATSPSDTYTHASLKAIG